MVLLDYAIVQLVQASSRCHFTEGWRTVLWRAWNRRRVGSIAAIECRRLISTKVGWFTCRFASHWWSPESA